MITEINNQEITIEKIKRVFNHNENIFKNILKYIK